MSLLLNTDIKVLYTSQYSELSFSFVMLHSLFVNWLHKRERVMFLKHAIMKFNTKTIHGGQEPDPAYGSVMPPIYQTSTYAQTTPGGHKGYEYATNTGNPTTTCTREMPLASIENGTYGLAFGSGLAAIDAVLKLLKPGDEVISTKRFIWREPIDLFTKIYEDFGIEVSFHCEYGKRRTLLKIISIRTQN